MIVMLLFPHTSFAARITPLTIGQTIDPGDPATVGGSCGPTDAFCFVAAVGADNQGTLLTDNALRFNFGSGLTATQASGTVTVIASGGGGSSSGSFSTLSSTGVTTLGNNSATVAIDSSDWDISATGVLTGISGITNDGFYTQSGTSANTFTGATTLSAAGTGLAVTNNVTIGGTLGVTGATTPDFSPLTKNFIPHRIK